LRPAWGARVETNHELHFHAVMLALRPAWGARVETHIPAQHRVGRQVAPRMGRKG